MHWQMYNVFKIELHCIISVIAVYYLTPDLYNTVKTGIAKYL